MTTNNDSPLPPPPGVMKLIGRAIMWAVVFGIGIAIFLYVLAHFFGDTDKSAQIALYLGPSTAVLMFIGVMLFQTPRAMKLSKGPFAFYLLCLTLPVLGLGALILWWFFQTGA